jgi:hypothetical protein
LLNPAQAGISLAQFSNKINEEFKQNFDLAPVVFLSESCIFAYVNLLFIYTGGMDTGIPLNKTFD